MKTKFLLLCALLTMQIRASDGIHFMRKLISTAVGICVVYGFEQDTAEDVVTMLHAIFDTKLKPGALTKIINSDKYHAHVKLPAYGLRGFAGIFTYIFLNAALDHENY